VARSKQNLDQHGLSQVYQMEGCIAGKQPTKKLGMGWEGGEKDELLAEKNEVIHDIRDEGGQRYVTQEKKEWTSGWWLHIEPRMARNHATIGCILRVWHISHVVTI
jgi:hypothetical protein